MMDTFIPGKKLSQAYYTQAVKPILKKHFPQLAYAAALIGPGSDVLGFDTPRSMDHDWGPRMLLFLDKKDMRSKTKISKILSENLPHKFKGFSTHFTAPEDNGVRVSKNAEGKSIQHLIRIESIDSFFKEYFNLNIQKNTTLENWLLIPQHKLLTIQSGQVFYDGIGLKKIIRKFNYYPKDIWLYLLAAQWKRIAQEEHFMGRCGELDDEIGSKIIAARLVKDIMGLCFLMEKQYMPYIKWLGTGFEKLQSAKKLKPILMSALKESTWKRREKHLSEAYEYIARMHNTLNITKPLQIKPLPFHDRPFLVIHAERFSNAILKEIKSPQLKNIKHMHGSIDQLANSTDLLEGNTQLLTKIYKH